jgi:DNA-directed RNA polymerase specialized sigma24 family protein
LAFPPTHHSVVLAVRSSDPEERERALEAVVAAYWRPVHRYLRARWGAPDEDAKDLAQGFFMAMLEKGSLARFDPGKGRFRTYLLACLDAYAANERRAASRLKRGGGTTLLPLDAAGPGGEVLDVPDGRDLHAAFQKEWAKGLFSLAVAALRARCLGTSKEVAFVLFERYDLDGDASERPSYADLAQELALPVTQVTNHLAWARRAFRDEVLGQLRAITASDEEFRMEARCILGYEAP